MRTRGIGREDWILDGGNCKVFNVVMRDLGLYEKEGRSRREKTFALYRT